MQIDFNRFASSQRYCCTVPLEQLALRVVITRALIVEENHVEVVTDTVIPWNSKIFSPSEQIDTWKKLRSVLQTKRQTEASLTPEGKLWLHSLEQRLPREPSPTPSSLSDASLFHCPTPKELLRELSKPPSWLFTRPSGEDYIDVRQEECPVLPPQGASHLAPVILRRHRQEHLPSNNFYMAWADGITTLKSHGNPKHSAVSPSAQRVPRRESSQHSQQYASQETRSTSRRGLSAPTFLQEVEDEDHSVSTTDDTQELNWDGEEYVFCTISMEQSEPYSYFTAKPTLGVEHTLRVDSSHIYRFRIDAQLKEQPPLNAVSEMGIIDSAPVPSGPAHKDDPVSSFPPSHLVQDPLAAGPSVVLPADLATFAAAVHDRYGPSSSGAGLASFAPPTQRTGTAAGFEAHSPGTNAAAPLTRDILKAVAQTVPKGRPKELSERRAVGLPGAGTSGSVAHGTDDYSSVSTVVPAPTARAVRFGLGPGAHSVTTSTSHYYVFGVVERCVGVSESTLFARGELYRSQAERGMPSAFSSRGAATFSEEEDGGGTTTVCSQLAYASTVMELDYFVAEPEHTFNMPFEYSYADEHDVPSLGVLPLSAPLRLAVGLYTEGQDGVGVQSACGYGCVSLPVVSPGTHKIVCPVWAIRKTGKEMMKSSLIGGAPSLINLRQAGPFPQAPKTAGGVRTGGSGITVKQGLVTESLGLVYITVNIVVQRDK